MSRSSLPSDLPSFPSVELDMAMAVARGFCLGDDPLAWTDVDIASTAETIAEAAGLDRDALAAGLAREREATRDRRH